MKNCTKIVFVEKCLNYKRIVLCIIFMAICLPLASNYLLSNKNYNYLYIGQFNLNNHFISVDRRDIDKVLILGNSAISGSNIPPNNTLGDHLTRFNKNIQFYNLAALQANLLDANVILDLISKKNVSIAILGIEPSILSVNQSSLFSKSHLKDIDPVLRNKIGMLFQESVAEKLELLTHSETVFPTRFQVWWKSFLLELRFKFWGPLFNKKIYGTEKNSLKLINQDSNNSWLLINMFVEQALQNKIIPVLFISPVLNLQYSAEDLIVFKNKIDQKSKELNFVYFDYSEFLPSTHTFFHDYTHLSPFGYEQLAIQLNKDLIGKKIIKDNRKI